MPKGALIGAGRTAEVHERDDDWVLKLYRDQFPLAWVRARAAHPWRLLRPVIGYVCGVFAPAYLSEYLALSGLPRVEVGRLADPGRCRAPFGRRSVGTRVAARYRRAGVTSSAA